MQNASTILKTLAALAAIVLIGLGIGWLATRGTHTDSQPPQNPPPGVVTHPSNPAPPPVPTNRQRSAPPLVVPRPTGVNTQTDPVLPGTTPAIATTNSWEDKLDEILSSESEDTNKVKQLFAMFPTLPPDGQEEVAQHLSNLVEDEDYAPLGRLLLNAKLPEDVLDTLMADLLNRPNAIKLPLFLEIARNPEHPQAEEGKDLLELYLDEEYGTDWNKWKEKMQEWLKENPD